MNLSYSTIVQNAIVVTSNSGQNNISSAANFEALCRDKEKGLHIIKTNNTDIEAREGK